MSQKINTLKNVADAIFIIFMGIIFAIYFYGKNAIYKRIKNIETKISIL